MALRVDDVDLVRDRALVERFQEGDPAAFETLYLRYFDRLTRYCQKRVGDHHEAEEIAQEAFARALRALPTFEGERRFYPWMTVIAGRLCVDSHRRRGRSEPKAVLDLGVIEGGQEDIVDAADLAVLSQALDRLAPRHREVLEMRENRGFTYHQIATHYGVTLGTVEALLFRARKALRREFLAVVGDERNWAAVPVLGVVLRRLAGARTRIEGWGASLPPLAAPALTIVVAVTTVTLAIGAGDAELRRKPAAPIVRAGDAADASLPSPSVAGHANGAGATAATPAGAATDRPAGPALEDAPLTLSSAQDGHREGANHPYAVGVDGVATVYLNPETATEDAAKSAGLLVQQGVEQ